MTRPFRAESEALPAERAYKPLYGLIRYLYGNYRVLIGYF